MSTGTAAESSVTPSEISEVRELVSTALRHYAAKHPAGDRRAGGVSAKDLASNVQGWTHATRLRGFVAATRVRKATS